MTGAQAEGETEQQADSTLEAELAQAIEPWLQHMRWRKDFDAWRERRIRQERYQESNLRDIRSALGDRPEGATMLDLGSGMGGLSVAALLELGPKGVRLQAMDYNVDYCRIARLRAMRYGLELAVAVGAGESLPYPDGAFDLVVSFDVLEHVQDPGAMMRQIHRVLKSGGVALATAPNRRAFRDPHYHLPLINWLPRGVAEWVIRRAGRKKEGGGFQDRQEHSELNTYTWGELRELANRSGFAARDQVLHRLRHGEIRQLGGIRRRILSLVIGSRLLEPVYAAYRYGWQGTFQVALLKPTGRS